jgi:glutamine cyclotransferase
MIGRSGVIALAGTSLLFASLIGCSGSSKREERPDVSSPGNIRSQIGPGTVVQVDPNSGIPTAVVPVGPDPLLVASASGRLWTLNLGDGSLSRVDPGTGRSTIVDREEVVGIASSGEDLWLAVGESTLARIDGATGEQEKVLRISRRPLFALRDAGFLTLGGGSIWLTVPKLGRLHARHSLWRIDPATGRVLAQIPLGPNPTPPISDGRYVWVLGQDGLRRVDMNSEKQAYAPVGDLPFGLAVGGGSAWVGDPRTQSLLRVDSRTLKVSDRIPLDETVHGVAFQGGLVWVATESGLQVVDPSTNESIRRIRLTDPIRDVGPIGIEYVGGSIWVSVE